MQLTSLSWLPDSPCILLKWPSVTVLLDCAIDARALASFLPTQLVNSGRLSTLPGYRSASKYSTDRSLKTCGDYVFVDGMPEVHPISLRSVSLESIDVILVSNWGSLVALPFFTEQSGFQGLVYCTDPTLQLGRLIIEEILEYCERIDKTVTGKEWRTHDIWSQFANSPTTDPMQWTSFYTTEQMNSALGKVKLIAFRETVNIHGVISVSAHSSGYSIGSCNWTISTEYEKVAYISAASSRTSHTKPVYWPGLRGADALILTSLCRFPEKGPEECVHKICTTVIETLKRNGNVLLPIAPIGVLYDLLEIIARNMEQPGISVDIPIYFISPVADSALAYSNIYAEWLSETRQNNVYIPEEPFPRSGRLKVYQTTYDNFSREYRQPCVVFTGHPSLRIGDAVHFLELWGGEARNAVILTDPQYPLEEVYGPFEKLAIRSFFFPIDTRLDFQQVNQTILTELAPKRLLLSEEYTRPPSHASSRVDFVVQFPRILPFKQNSKLTLPSLLKRKRIRLHPDVARQIDITQCGDNTDTGMCPIRGFLSAYDNVLELMPDNPALRKDSIVGELRPRLMGILDPKKLVERLHKNNIRGEYNAEKSMVRVPAWNATITISADGLKTRISCSQAGNRRKLAEAVGACLKSL